MRLIFPTLLLLLLFSSCQQDSPANAGLPERGHSPWAVRSVLDGQARMLSLALSNGHWAAYSAQNGQFYKFWKGGINFDGAVYTTVHGPQPSSIGDAYTIQPNEAQQWRLRTAQGEVAPAVKYLGHRFESGQVYLKYELRAPGSPPITVEERPEILETGNGQVGLERSFTATGLPEGATLLLHAYYQSLPTLRSLETNGQLSLTDSLMEENSGRRSWQAEGWLALNPSGPTRLAAIFTAEPTIPNPNTTVDEAEAELPEGARLIARSDCKACHNTHVKTVGPAYVEIARRYPNNSDNVAMLAAKIKNGGAGNWGEAMMTPHPDLDDATLETMASYILGLDGEAEAGEEAQKNIAPAQLAFVDAEPGVQKNELLPGVLAQVFQYNKSLQQLSDINFQGTPEYEGIMPNIYIGPSEFQSLSDNFAISFQGYLAVPKDNNYVFRLRSDDGSRLILGGKEIIDHDGWHGPSPKDGEVALRAGLHPIRIEFFQGGGGKFVSLEWKSFDDDKFALVPPTQFFHTKAEQPAPGAEAPPMAQTLRIPGHKYPVNAVHPSYTLSQARPDGFMPKVGGMDFLSDGRLVVSTWDAEGAVYIVDGVQSGDPDKMTARKIASGLAEPLGLKVVDDTIYVLQKQELTRLIDHDGDEVADEYQTVSNDWEVSANFHEFTFGLAYKEGFFYAALAIAILPGGASANPQIPDRGKAIRISKQTGAVDFIARGLRTPNGVGLGVDNELFIADNQGDWLPSCKILHITEGDFFGSRAVDSATVAQLPVKRPVVWLPQDEIGNSPSTPLALNDGPYKGQMIHGEVTHGGVKRVFVEKVKGEYQGAVFRFIQGLEAGVNRMAWGPDGALYVGGIGSTGNWQHTGTQWYGLQRLQYNENPAFEMLSVSARSNGMEITFTEPLEPGTGWLPGAYTVQQWWYKPTSSYGGPKMDLEDLTVKSATVSEDRRKVFLELDGMKAGHVIYIRLPYQWVSESGLELWSTEAWYTLNNIPEGKLGTVKAPPPAQAPNTLSDAERAAGWQLLFDGESTTGWRNFNADTLGRAWKVDNGALYLDPGQKPEGAWQADGGGDIITASIYEDFEFKIDWKIAPCGNSGVFFNVQEGEGYSYVWHTGPEMQVLDNTCHPDAQYETHRAGCLYDLIPVKYEAASPAGEWNESRIISQNGQVSFWLNGRKLVSFEMHNDEWKDRIAASKFQEMPDFGLARKGHIALQDHGDPVWFRNIKIRPLD